MPRTIEYYFSMPSPWAYLGHATFVEMANRHGAAINYKPVPLGRVSRRQEACRWPSGTRRGSATG